VIKKHDADKGWYKNYFMVLKPKLDLGGCFTAHNATSGFGSGIFEFLEYVQSLPNFIPLFKNMILNTEGCYKWL